MWELASALFLLVLLVQIKIIRDLQRDLANVRGRETIWRNLAEERGNALQAALLPQNPVPELSDLPASEPAPPFRSFEDDEGNNDTLIGMPVVKLNDR